MDGDSGSSLIRKLHVVEGRDKLVVREYGALLGYSWTGPIIDFPPQPHGNARLPGALAKVYTRTAPSTMLRVKEKLEQESIGKKQVFEETNREVCCLGML